MNAFAKILAPWLADYFLLSTFLLMMVLVLCRRIGQPAQRLAIARPTLAALFLLTGLCALPGWSLVHLLTAEGAAPSGQEVSNVHVAPPIEQPVTPLIPPSNLDSLIPSPSPTSDSIVLSAPVSIPLPWTSWLVVTYLCGCLLTIAWQASGGVLARRLIRNAVPAPPQLQTLLAEIGVNAKRLPNLQVSDRIQTPVALGVLHPTILLPQEMLESQKDSLRPILAHELAHLRHGDLQTLAAVRILMILLWPQPLYWLLRRHVRRDQETLADAAAADVTSRADFAEQLVAWARVATEARTPRLVSSVGLWESASQLKQRVAMLLDAKLTILRSCSRRWRWTCVVFAAAAALGLSLITLEPSTEAADKADDDPAVADLSEEQKLQLRLAIETISKPGLVNPVEEWGPAVRTLVEIGPPAVPSLIEALDGEVRDHPIRKLAYTLRAIGDARAIPALIRAIPRTHQPPASDYGLGVKDDELAKFLRQYDTQDDGALLTYGRAFREVVLTLQEMTDGVTLGEMELNFVHKQGTQTQQVLQRDLFEKAAARWAQWWEANWEDYVSESRYAKVGLSSQASSATPLQDDVKPVRFPVGDDIQLDAETIGITISPAQNPRRDCFLDLDTGRQAGWPSELPEWGTVDENSSELIDWARKQGFDLLGVLENGNSGDFKYGVRMIDIRAWQITDAQFQELPPAMRGEAPYPLGTPVQRMEPLRHSSMFSTFYRDFEGNTYLFRTREGSYGVLKLHEPGEFPYPSVKAAVKFFIQSKDEPTSEAEPVEGYSAQFVVESPPADSDEKEPSGQLFSTPATPPADADSGDSSATESEAEPGTTGLSHQEKRKLVMPLYKRLHEKAKPNTIHGMCIDENGQPLASVLVQVFSGLVDGSEDKADPILTTKSDEAGEFSFTDVIDVEKKFPDGLPEEHFPERERVILTVVGRVAGRVPGFGSNFASSIARRGESLVWVMQPAETLRGRVTDGQGKPIAGAQVTAGLFSMFHSAHGINTAVTDANGEYMINDLAAFDAAAERRKTAAALKADPNNAALRYSQGNPRETLIVKHPKFAARRATVERIPGRVDVQLVPGSVIKGTVKLPEGAATTQSLAGSVVRLQRVVPEVHTKGQVGAVSFFGYQIEKTTVDDIGHYRLESLPAGKYHLTADVEGWVTQGVEDVEVEVGKTATAPDILLTRGGRVRVQLVDDETGEPMRFEKPTKGYINPQQRPQRAGIFMFRNNIVEFSTDGVVEIQIPAGQYAFFVSIPIDDGSVLISVVPEELDEWPTYKVVDGELLDILTKLRIQKRSQFTATLRAAGPPADDEAAEDGTAETTLTPETPVAETEG